jgi:hypothetical protein
VNNNGLFQLAFVAIGAVTTLRGIWALLSARLFERRASRVSATVTDMRERYIRRGSNTGSSRSRVWVPVVRFAAGDGRTVESETAGYLRLKRVEAGDSLDVVFDPGNPTDVRLPLGWASMGSSLASIVVGLVFVLLALTWF